WGPAYSEPIRLGAGERFHLAGRQDIWDGHIRLWAVSAAGLGGNTGQPCRVAGGREPLRRRTMRPSNRPAAAGKPSLVSRKPMVGDIAGRQRAAPAGFRAGT